MNWQPIETAPKDGTKILVGRFVKQCASGKNKQIHVDYWHSAKSAGFEGFGRFNQSFWPATTSKGLT